MKVNWKKIGLVLVVFVIAIAGFLIWYKNTYSMDVAEAFEVNSPQLEQKILIATQGSEFKDKVVAGLVEKLRERDIFIKVIDVSSLPSIDVDDYNAIVLLHDWELQKPPAVVEQFLKKSGNNKKLVVLATSGGSDTSMKGIDGISGESILDEAPDRVNQIMLRLEPLIK